MSIGTFKSEDLRLKALKCDLVTFKVKFSLILRSNIGKISVSPVEIRVYCCTACLGEGEAQSCCHGNRFRGVKWQVSDLVVKMVRMMDYGGVTRQSKRKREIGESMEQLKGFFFSRQKCSGGF